MKTESTLIERIEEMGRAINIDFIAKLNMASDPETRKGITAEAKFALFFWENGISFTMHREGGSENRQADFTLQCNGQTLFAEVTHINPSEGDITRNTALDKTIETFQTENPGVPIISSGQIIEWKPVKLYGSNSEMIKKAVKYASQIKESNNPFLICLTLDFRGALDLEDLSYALYGPEVQFMSNGFDIPFMPDGLKFHEHMKGHFYRDDTFKDVVSGVLLLWHGEKLIYFHNYQYANRLNCKNVDFLCQFIYSPLVKDNVVDR